MEREHKIAASVEKFREDIAKVRDRLSSEAETWWQMHSGKQVIHKDSISRCII
jgi:hypothetical protein